MGEEPNDDELLLEQEIDEQPIDETVEEPPVADDETLSFDDEPGPDEEPAEPENLVKHLRTVAREKEADRLRLIRENEQLRKQMVPAIVRKPKPDLWEDCEGDPDKFEKALLDWTANEAKAKDAEATGHEQQREIMQVFDNARATYATAKASYPAAMFEPSESAFLAAFNDDQQTIIAAAVKDPARFVLALGKSPGAMAALGKHKNPIVLAAEAARIEAKGASTMTRRAPPNPDTPVRGNARVAGSADKELERLEKAADKSGDRTALIKYRTSLRDNGGK